MLNTVFTDVWPHKHASALSLLNDPEESRNPDLSSGTLLDLLEGFRSADRSALLTDSFSRYMQYHLEGF